MADLPSNREAAGFWVGFLLSTLLVWGVFLAPLVGLAWWLF